MNNVIELLVQYVFFQGNEHSGTALDLIDTTAQIVNCTFVSNSKGNFKNNSPSHSFSGSVGGAIIAINCTLKIIQSNFSKNGAGTGGAIFAKQSISLIITLLASVEYWVSTAATSQ